MRQWVVMAALGVAACGGDTAASNGMTPVQAVALRDFDAIVLDSPDSVDVRRGQDFAIAIDGPPDVRRKLTFQRDDNVLRIGRKPGGGSNVGRGVARIRVTMPSIRAATLSGSGDIAIDQAADPFVATLGGSGDMTIGQVRGDKATLTVSGSGSIAAAGAVRDLTLSVAGSGDVEARQLRADAATVSVTGSGDVAAQVEGPARVSLVGSGSADLGAGARCTVDRVGTGEAHCG